MTTRLALRIFVGVGLSLLFYIGSSQHYPCIREDECPHNCYPAEFLRFDHGCGVSGTFPNQKCCLTVLAVYACRKNSDCTGEVCGSMRYPAFNAVGDSPCFEDLTSVTCGGFTYIKGTNKIIGGGTITIYPIVTVCPGISIVVEIELVI
jgi:hypothetical protein